jgi:hypothetical protein
LVSLARAAEPRRARGCAARVPVCGLVLGDGCSACRVRSGFGNRCVLRGRLNCSGAGLVEARLGAPPQVF